MGGILIFVPGFTTVAGTAAHRCTCQGVRVISFRGPAAKVMLTSSYIIGGMRSLSQPFPNHFTFSMGYMQHGGWRVCCLCALMKQKANIRVHSSFHFLECHGRSHYFWSCLIPQQELQVVNILAVRLCTRNTLLINHKGMGGRSGRQFHFLCLLSWPFFETFWRTKFI